MVQRVRPSIGGRDDADAKTTQTRDHSERSFRYISRNVRLHKISVNVVLIASVNANRYFEGGVSSVYLWDLDDGGFAGVVLLKKSPHF